MKCYKGHEMRFQEDAAEFTDWFCPECNQMYWEGIFGGLYRYDEDGPCEEGFHDWHEVSIEDDTILECSRCGLIDA